MRETNFYDSAGNFVRDLDTLRLDDSTTRILPQLRSVTLSLPHALSGKVMMRRLTETGLIRDSGATWYDKIRVGRLSNAGSGKRAGRGGIRGAQASILASPNPFTNSTLLQFNLPEEAIIDLEIYNSTGQLIRTLIERGHYRAGSHKVLWNADDLPNGAYLVKLRYNHDIITQRTILMR